ncbi:MAG TPA: endonuclease III [Bacteroidia bacterium]|nr:endonuclease III [Bacteroidia bacterium]
MTIGERYKAVIDYFLTNMPAPETELSYKTPFELLVAVILSAQCTDKRVNLVTPALFNAYPDAIAMSKALPEDIFPFIKSISYPNNKAKNLAGMSRMLVQKFNNKLPETVEELQQLPGVGRKTANVIASVVFNQSTMAVDTHVFRVAARLGLTRNATTPLAAEKQLMKHLPLSLVPKAHHWLILHGRYTCLARSPKCSACGLTACCNYYRSHRIKK